MTTGWRRSLANCRDRKPGPCRRRFHLGKNLLEGLAAVDRSKDAALGVRAVGTILFPVNQVARQRLWRISIIFGS